MQLTWHAIEGLRVEQNLIAVAQVVIILIVCLRVRRRRIRLVVCALVAHCGVVHDHRAAVFDGKEVRLVTASL